MTGESERPPKVPGNPETAEGGDPSASTDSLEELLKLAVSREQKASDFYRKAAERATDDSGRRLLEYLARMEKGHEIALKNELETYLNDRSWYAGDPDIQLV